MSKTETSIGEQRIGGVLPAFGRECHVPGSDPPMALIAELFGSRQDDAPIAQRYRCLWPDRPRGKPSGGEVSFEQRKKTADCYW